MIWRIYFVILLFTSLHCTGQDWEAEVMAGVSKYNGDLTQHVISLKNIGPAVSFNVKYNFDNFILIRGGISWAQLSGDDKNNKQADLKNRNLNFHTDIIEASLCAELNLLEPGFYYSYPYLFGGVGVFHFDPYTYDKDNVKTYLQPLSTEGQGLVEYPWKKPYKLIQFCLPVGGGIKFQINKKWDVVYEIGFRFLLTDYLDDVSTSYVNPQKLLIEKGIKSVELANRQQVPHENDIRGNPKNKDSYAFTGIKLLVHLGRYKD